MADGSIKIDTKIDDSGMKKGIKSIKSGLANIGKAVAIGAAGITAKFTAATASVIKFAGDTDRIDKLSQKLGVSRQSFQELDFVMSQSGTSIDSMQMGMRTLQEKIDNNSSAFNELGISIQNVDGTMKSQDQVLYESISAFQKMEDGVEKSRLATELFGRSGSELMPLLNGQAGSFEEMTKQANELGLVLGDDVVDAGVVFTDALDQLKRAGSALMNNVIAPLVPLFTDLVDKFRDLLVQNINMEGLKTAFINIIKFGYVLGSVLQQVLEIVFSVVSSMIDYFKSLSGCVDDSSAAFEFMGKVIAGFESALKIAGIAIQRIISIIIDLVSLIRNSIDIFVKFFKGDFAGAGAAAKGAWGDIVSIKDNIVGGWKDIATAVTTEIETFAGRSKASAKKIEKAFNSFKITTDGAENAGEKTGEAFINETSKTIQDNEKSTVDAAKKIFANIGMAIQKSIAIIQKVVKGFVSAIKNTISSIGSAITGIAEFDTQAIYDKFEVITKGLKNFFMEDIGASTIYFQAGVDIFNNFLDGITSNSENIFKSITNAVETIITIVRDNMPKWNKQIGDFINQLSIVILENLPDILQLFGDIILGMFRTAKEGFPKILHELRKALSEVIKTASVIIPELLDIISEVVTNIVSFLLQDSSIVDSFLNLIWSVTEVISSHVPDVIQLFIKLVNYIVLWISDNLGQMVDLFLNVLFSIIDVILENIKPITQVIFTLIVSIITVLIKRLPKIIELFIGLLIKIVESILDNMPVVIQGIIQLIMGIIGAIIKMIPDLVAAFISMIPILIAAIIQSMPQVISGIIQLIMGIIGAVIENLPLIVEAFIMAIPLIVKGIWDNRHKIAEAFVKMGQQSMDGFVDGIKDFGKRIWDRVKKTFEDFGKKVKNFFGIKSPSRVFAGYGGYLVQGLEEGFNTEGKGMFNAVSGTLDNFNDDVSGAFGSDYNMNIGANTRAIDNVMKGLQAGNFGLNANINSLSSQAIVLNNNINGVIQVDGRTLGEIAFKNIDRVTRGAYGY